MKKWIFIGIGAVAVILAIILVVGILNLGPIVKISVNTYGPKITDTEVRVDDVSISIFASEAKLKKFFIGNPKGFKSPIAMKVESVFVNVDKGSLKGNTLIINKIEVVGPEITYEKKGKTDNFKTLLSNVQKNILKSRSSSKQQTEKEGEGKQLIIRNFILRNGKVNLVMSMPGGVLGDKSISAGLPDIHLKDIGKKKGGASPAEVFKEIFAALHAKITSPNVMANLNEQLKALGASTEAVEKAAKEGLEKASGLAEGAKKELEDATGKIKGLFK